MVWEQREKLLIWALKVLSSAKHTLRLNFRSEDYELDCQLEGAPRAMQWKGWSHHSTVNWIPGTGKVIADGNMVRWEWTAVKSCTTSQRGEAFGSYWKLHSMSLVKTDHWTSCISLVSQCHIFCLLLILDNSDKALVTKTYNNVMLSKICQALGKVI